MVLDQTGMSGWGWSQCSPVTINTLTKRVTYEGSYWATKHFSFYIEPNATVFRITGAGNDKCIEVNGACGCTAGCSRSPSLEFIAFRNPGGEFIVIGQNLALVEQPVLMMIDGVVAFHEKLPPESMNTFVLQANTGNI